jgi:molecular chaperone Hsp33
MDQLIRGITENREIRFLAISSADVVEKARQIHALDQVSTVIMGRTLAGALMLAADLKDYNQLLTLKIDSDGLINSVLATADRAGNVKGYLRYNQEKKGLSSDRVVPMQEALGKGNLTVIKDLGMKEPYIGTVELKYGTIGRDLTYYFAISEQTPSAVGLGVLLNEKDQVRQAGGFIIQMLPEASENTIKKVESNLQQFPNFTDVLDMGYGVEQIMKEHLLKGFDPVFLEKREVKYKCDCSKSRFESGLMLLSKDDLQEMIKAGRDITVNCHFCNTDYNFTLQELKTIMQRKK